MTPGRVLLVIWLAAYTVLPIAIAILALIFAFEGFALARRRPETILLTASATLFLIGWPVSVIAGWILLAMAATRQRQW